jgi:integrase
MNLDEEILLVSVLRHRYPEYVSMFKQSAAIGMRMSEQLRARVGDYNHSAKLLTVPQKKDRNKPKIRYVPSSKKGVEAFEQLANGTRPKALLCVNTAGNRMADVTNWFKPALERAGIGSYHWHDNRHTACSRGLIGGVPLAAVAKYVGHSTIQMTMRYPHLVPKVNQVAVDAMDAFYASPVECETDTGTPASFPYSGK